MIFSGGLSVDRAGRTPSLTVIHGKTTTVLEMEHNVLGKVTKSIIFTQLPSYTSISL